MACLRKLQKGKATMGNFLPGRYCLTKSESLAIIASAKRHLLAEHPELKPFQNEIGSYIARAVEGRNERGIARTGDSLKEDEAAQARYMAELTALAEREARQCLRRFRDRPESIALLKQLQEDKQEPVSTTKIKDFETLPLTW